MDKLNIIDEMNKESKTFVVWNDKSGKIVRVVDCNPLMVTMSGSWSSDYRYKDWDNILAENKKADELQQQNKELQDKLSKAVEALKFYQTHADCKTMNIKCACKYCVGDDRFRKTLKEIGES